MVNRIELEGRPIELDSSVGWLYIYRNNFGRDILPDIMPVFESFLTIAADVLGRSKKETVDVYDIIGNLDGDLLNEIFINLSGMETITIFNILWAMAKKADKTIPSPEEFFDDFEVMPLDIIIPELFSMLINSFVSSKNAESLRGMLKKPNRSTLTNSQ